MAKNDAEWERGANFIGNALPFYNREDANADGNSVVLKPMTTDEVVQIIAESCSHAIGVSVDESILHEHVGPLCLRIEPSLFLAKTMLRTKVVEAVLGSSLALIVRRRQFESDWGQEWFDGSVDAEPLHEVIKE